MPPSHISLVTDSLCGNSLLRKSTFADPNVPAERITRPMPGVTLTTPDTPGPTEPPFEHSSSTPVTWPPVRTSLRALVFVNRLKPFRAAALRR
jgi:hypothetical protein